VTTTEHDTLLALAHDAYSRYYHEWLLSDTRERVIANIAAQMGIDGCAETFEVRCAVAREIVERMSYEERTV